MCSKYQQQVLPLPLLLLQVALVLLQQRRLQLCCLLQAQLL
jgi:hypothetical protein